ncbi:MAG: preprotein translocase subunit SecG, partial [Burkholderiales bacterium]
MEAWMTLIVVLHVLVAMAIIGLVLLQHGKGADMGSGFGGGASGSLFGATGSANFLSRMTAVLATIFFLTSLGLAYVATNKPKSSGGVMDAVKTEQPAPAKPAAQTPAAPADIPQPAAAPTEGSKAKDVP